MGTVRHIPQTFKEFEEWATPYLRDYAKRLFVDLGYDGFHILPEEFALRFKTSTGRVISVKCANEIQQHYRSLRNISNARPTK